MSLEVSCPALNIYHEAFGGRLHGPAWALGAGGSGAGICRTQGIAIKGRHSFSRLSGRTSLQRPVAPGSENWQPPFLRIMNLARLPISIQALDSGLTNLPAPASRLKAVRFYLLST